MQHFRVSSVAVKNLPDSACVWIFYALLFLFFCQGGRLSLIIVFFFVKKYGDYTRSSVLATPPNIVVIVQCYSTIHIQAVSHEEQNWGT